MHLTLTRYGKATIVAKNTQHLTPRPLRIMTATLNVVSWPCLKTREKVRNQNNRTSGNELEKGVPRGTFLELTQRVQLTWKRNEPGPRPLWAVGKKRVSSADRSLLSFSSRERHSRAAQCETEAF